jgi:hypothetical protein
MARTREEIEAQILATIGTDPILSGLSSNSYYAVFRRIAVAVSVVIYGVELLFDILKSDVNWQISNLKPHGKKWYVNKAKAFQYGSQLVEDTDYYDNTNLTPEQVLAQQIIAEANVVENDGRLIMKAVKDESGVLVPLEGDEYDAFEAYVKEFKDAGVRVQVLSFNADKLKIAYDVYYDPTVLGSNGAMLDGSSEDPVGDTIKAFIRATPFDGVFILAHCTDAIQKLDGVEIPVCTLCEAGRYDSTTYVAVSVKYQPYSGFLRIYSDLDITLNFIPNA